MPFTVKTILLATLVFFSTLPQAKKSDDELPLLELQTFAEVFDQIKKNYVEEVDSEELIRSGIQGMLTGLDPHSSYLTPDMFEDLEISTKGEFGGLGIEVTMENGFVKVVAPIDDTPAQKAGVMAGDLIVRLNETPVKGLNLREAVQIMRGKVGTDIQLTIIRQNVDTPLKIKITRDVIKVKSIRSKLYDDQFGYVRISQFQTKTGDDLANHLDQLIEKSNNQLKGIVIDLRNNPGGVLGAAVEVADMFLKKDQGLIVYTEGRIHQSQMKFDTKVDDKINGLPIVVLINAGSASGSEIVAGALQDHKRAVIMGTKTFGKGSVQTVLPLRNKRALKLTTAQYFTPNGRSIQAEGIEPDILIETLQIQAEQANEEALRYKEADLKGHLDNPTDSEDKPSDTAAENKNDSESTSTSADLVKTDFQLYEAINLLKGLSIVNN